MGKLTDQFKEKKNYNNSYSYNCNFYTPSYDQTNNNYNNSINKNNNKIRTPDGAFAGYDGSSKKITMYRLDKWDGNYNTWNGK